MSADRIYRIRDRATGFVVLLVQAGTPAQAMRHIASRAYSCHVASGAEVANDMGAGIKHEKATRPQGELPIAGEAT